MTDEPPTRQAGQPSQQAPPRIVPALQILSLLSFVGYAVLGMIREVPLDRYVLLGILTFGLGLRPEAVGQVLRGFTNKP